MTTNRIYLTQFAMAIRDNMSANGGMQVARHVLLRVLLVSEPNRQRFTRFFRKSSHSDFCAARPFWLLVPGDGRTVSPSKRIQDVPDGDGENHAIGRHGRRSVGLSRRGAHACQRHRPAPLQVRWAHLSAQQLKAYLSQTLSKLLKQQHNLVQN